MLKKTQVKEFISMLISLGETIDLKDVHVFDAWLYCSYLALEPFPSEYGQYREHCFDSFDVRSRRLTAALVILKSASKKAERSLQFRKSKTSDDYVSILNGFLQNNQQQILQA
jgi:hypothetical protein